MEGILLSRIHGIEDSKCPLRLNADYSKEYIKQLPKLFEIDMSRRATHWVLTKA
tara:strand:- start:300 stop:461 length:162 start_codon:yes stop_codon:yes gene_type:complete